MNLTWNGPRYIAAKEYWDCCLQSLSSLDSCIQNLSSPKLRGTLAHLFGGQFNLSISTFYVALVSSSQFPISGRESSVALLWDPSDPDTYDIQMIIKRMESLTHHFWKLFFCIKIFKIFPAACQSIRLAIQHSNISFLNGVQCGPCRTVMGGSREILY